GSGSIAGEFVDCQNSRVREEKAGACEWERAAGDVVSSAPRAANWLLQRLYVWPCLISFLCKSLYLVVKGNAILLQSFFQGTPVLELSSACGNRRGKRKRERSRKYILQRPINK